VTTRRLPGGLAEEGGSVSLQTRDNSSSGTSKLPSTVRFTRPFTRAVAAGTSWWHTGREVVLASAL